MLRTANALAHADLLQLAAWPQVFKRDSTANCQYLPELGPKFSVFVRQVIDSSFIDVDILGSCNESFIVITLYLTFYYGDLISE